VGGIILSARGEVTFGDTDLYIIGEFPQPRRGDGVC